MVHELRGQADQLTKNMLKLTSRMNAAEENYLDAEEAIKRIVEEMEEKEDLSED